MRVSSVMLGTSVIRWFALVEDVSPCFPHPSFYRYRVMLACQRLEKLAYALVLRLSTVLSEPRRE